MKHNADIGLYTRPQGVNPPMTSDTTTTSDRKMTSLFERYLSLWVLLCIIAGILLVKICLNTRSWFEND
jgi:hypothetical protein